VVSLLPGGTGNAVDDGGGGEKESVKLGDVAPPSPVKVALACVGLGWRVVPAHATEKRPGLNDWPNVATVDVDQVTWWWHESGSFTGRPVCLVTGRESGVWVLDVDVKDDGESALRALVAERGELPETFEVRTPSGGRHLYFSYPADREVKSTARQLGPGLDTRGRGGQVMAPGTTVGGRQYRVVNPVLPLPEAPAWLLDLVEVGEEGAWSGSGNGGDGAGLDELVERLLEDGLPTGAHDETLARVAAKLATRGVGDHEALTVLRALIAATETGEKGWSDENLLGKLASARKKFPAPEALDPALVAWATGVVEVVPPSAEVLAAEAEAESAAVGKLRSTAGEPPESAANRDNFGNPGVPVEAASAVLKRLFGWTDGQKRRPGLKHWRSEWRSYTGTHWAAVSEDAMKAVLYRFFADATYQVPVESDDGKLAFEDRAWNPNRGKVGDVLAALAGLTEEPESTEMPSWLGASGGSGVTVPCENGLLRVTGTERRLVSHDVGYFCGYALPFPYNPLAGCPRWLTFLEEVFPGDVSSAELLQEWFGYVISGRLDQHKMMALVGASRSGKSTIAKVLTRLLGTGNVAAPTLSSFTMNFGLSAVIGKPLAVVDDARYSSRMDVQAMTERLLTVVSGGQLDVDRKNKPVWTGVLPCRVMILSNELPNFKDSSDAITNRMLVLHFKESFLGREDLKLVEKLELELGGILNWALEGLARLERRGRFGVAAGAAGITAELKESVNPMGAFLAEHGRVGMDEWCVASDFIAEWALWLGGKVDATSRGFETTVGQKLRAAVPSLERKRVTVSGRGRVYCYYGVSLRGSVVAWAEQVTGEASTG
jgi:putative DNA primase/helicase